MSVFVNDVPEAMQAQDRLEESVQHAQRRLAEIEAIYTSAPTGLCVLDDQLRFTRVNHRMAEINHLPAAAHIGKTPREIAPEFGDQVEAALRRLLETGEPLLDFEMSGRSPHDGEIHYWSNRWVPLKDEAGKIIGVSVSIEETTERRNALNALQKSERLYRAIGESLQWGIWICDAAGGLVYASESILKLVGKTPEECRAQGLMHSIHPDDVDRIALQWKECVTGRGVWDAEFRYRGADGLDYPVLARGTPVHDDSGNIICWAGINLDMRRAKETEAALSDQVAEFETLFRELPIAVGVSRDSACEHVRVNPAFAELLGIPCDENASKDAPMAMRFRFAFCATEWSLRRPIFPCRLRRAPVLTSGTSPWK